MSMRMPFPADLGWSVYGLSAGTFGEPLVKGYGFSHSSVHPPYGQWRHEHVTLVYGESLDENLPNYRVTSAPHFSHEAVSALHHGLGQAGFVFGMSGTGHISGAPEPPRRQTVHLDDVPVEADVWRGPSAEVAWIATADTWVLLLASKNTLEGVSLGRLEGVSLGRITDLNPLIEARRRTRGRPDR